MTRKVIRIDSFPRRIVLVEAHGVREARAGLFQQCIQASADKIAFAPVLGQAVVGKSGITSHLRMQTGFVIGSFDPRQEHPVARFRRGRVLNIGSADANGSDRCHFVFHVSVRA
jgi:hypothetical protein